MKKAVIYARYSSERQSEKSIEGQLKECNRFAEHNNIEIVEYYIDRAMSGTNDNRLEFQRMLADSKNASWSIVLVYAIDRFGRNSIEVAVNKGTLKKNGKTLISATQKTSSNIDGTQNLDGILLENLYIGIAEYYSAELSQKVKRGMSLNRERGEFCGGNIPYGYRVENKKLLINEAEAEIVYQIYKAYSEGVGVPKILQELNNKGILNNRKAPFARNTIYRMLRTTAYIGIHKYNNEIITNLYPAIINKDLWDKVQRINEMNKLKPNSRKSKGEYLLTGKLYCGECGALMIGDSGVSQHGVTYKYYSCSKKNSKLCVKNSIRKDLLEDFIFENIIEITSDIEFMSKIADNVVKIHKNNIDNNIILRELKVQLANNKTALNNLIKAIEEGCFNKYTDKRMKELEQIIEKLEYAIDCETRNEGIVVTKERFLDYINSIIKSPETKSQDYRKNIVNMLIQKIILYNNGDVKIFFNYSDNYERTTDVDVNSSFQYQVVHLQGLEPWAQ